MRKRILGVLVAGVTAATLAVAGTAYAVSTFRTGGSTTKQYIATSSDPFLTPGPNTWQTVPATSIGVSITGGRKLITARFGAESLCQGTGWCAVRVVYTPVGGLPVELAPQSGVDFAFDSDSTGGLWEQHSIERTSAVYLPNGNYRVAVQARRVNSSVFRLDDYHLNVGLIAP